MRFVFVFPYPLPTYKAEGQIAVNTCAAFDRLGVDGLLLHPAADRAATVEMMPSGSPAEHYELPPHLELKSYRPVGRRRAGSGLGSMLWRHLMARRAAALAARERADFYFTWDSVVAWRLSRAGCRTIYEAATFPPRSVRPFARWLGLKSSTVVFTAHTEHLVSDLTACLRLPRGRIKLLRGGVQLRGPADRSQARAALGLRLDEPIAVYTGGLRQDRGIEVLIEVAARLPRVRFLVVGGLPADAAWYQGLIGSRRVSNIVVHGHVTPERARSFQAAADVLLLPQSRSSRHLTHYVSPAKVFEYMDAGRPIVASDLPCIREILADGRNALLVDNGSPDAWASAIEKLLTDSSLAPRLTGVAAREVRAHSWDARAARMLEWLGFSPAPAQASGPAGL
jgi:glycosyltransferase involved in cell wall biosynthesis